MIVHLCVINFSYGQFENAKLGRKVVTLPKGIKTYCITDVLSLYTVDMLTEADRKNEKNRDEAFLAQVKNHLRNVLNKKGYVENCQTPSAYATIQYTGEGWKLLGQLIIYYYYGKVGVFRGVYTKFYSALDDKEAKKFAKGVTKYLGRAPQPLPKGECHNSTLGYKPIYSPDKKIYRIADVFPGGAAEEAGMKAGDMLIAVNNYKYADDPDKADKYAINAANNGETLKLQIKSLESGKLKTIKVSPRDYVYANLNCK